MFEVFFTPQHEWVALNGRTAVVGLTAKGLSGDVVYIELPEVGQNVEKGTVCASVETAKAVTEVHAPLSGVVMAVNDAVFDDPDSISRQPLDTWLFKLDTRDGDNAGLLTEREYAALEQIK